MGGGYDVFLSYNSADHVIVEQIADALHKQHQIKPFLDRWHLVPGHDWVAALEQALVQCRSVIIFIGPTGFGPVQQRERNAAFVRQAKAPDLPVIPVLLPGAVDPGLGFLSLSTWVDLSNDPMDLIGLETLKLAINGKPPNSLDFNDPRAVICPYRGLEPFREEDAAFFFGREAFITKLMKRLKTRNFLMVMGASGSGKSSVVNAGLVPALRKGKESSDESVWKIITIRPGTSPLRALADAFEPEYEGFGLAANLSRVKIAAELLRNGDVTLADYVQAALEREIGTERLLLIVDQFEELYNLSDDAIQERELFLDMVLEATAGDLPFNVVGTMRADFLSQALKRRDLSDRLDDAGVMIGPLTRIASASKWSELESIIRAPATAVGLKFEDGLVERILGDVGNERGNLPLLEFLLKALWEARRSGFLTHEAYNTLEGVDGAVAAHAQAAFETLSTEERLIARRLFLSLVTPGEGREDTRARAPIPEESEFSGIVSTFAAPGTRLLVTTNDPALGRVVEVSHESLIRNWQAMREWVDANRDILRIRDRVRRAMVAWQEKNFNESLFLAPGIALEEGRKLLSTQSEVPTDELKSYIEASIKADDANTRVEVDRIRRERRTEKRLMRVAGIAVICLTFLGFKLYKQQSETREQNVQLNVTKLQLESTLEERDGQAVELKNALKKAEDEEKKASSTTEQLKALGINLRKALEESRRQEALATDAKLEAVAAQKEAEIERERNAAIRRQHQVYINDEQEKERIEQQAAAAAAAALEKEKQRQAEAVAAAAAAKRKQEAADAARRNQWQFNCGQGTNRICP